MTSHDLTNRDKQYLRALFLMSSHQEPVGPAKIARTMGVSRTGALKKLRRLEFLGYGDYVDNKGLLLNSRGVDVVQKDTLKHHLMEKFLETSLDMDPEEACHESSALDPLISTRLMERVNDKYGEELSCDCGCCIEPYYEPETLVDCHWYQRMFKMQ